MYWALVNDDYGGGQKYFQFAYLCFRFSIQLYCLNSVRLWLKIICWTRYEEWSPVNLLFSRMLLFVLRISNDRKITEA